MSSDVPPDWPRPLKLLCICLAIRGGAGEGAQDTLLALSQGMTEADWDQFANLAINEHRVVPQIEPILNKLDGISDAVRTRLVQAIRQNAIQTLSQIAETRQVIGVLEQIGAQPVVIKGWPLAQSLFGQANARHCSDIDIAILPDKVSEGYTALAALGYAHDTGFKREARIHDSHSLAEEGKDLRLVHADTGMVAELHWNLLPYRGWPKIIDRPGAIVEQQTQAKSLRVLSDQANMLYLPLHGGLHMWTRLKWLADIAPLVRRRGADGLAEDMALARELGIARPISIGMKLAARLLGSPLPRGMDLGPPGRVERFMLDTITRDDMIPGKSPRYRAWARLNALRLAEGAQQKWGVIRYDTLRRWRWRLADLRR